MGRIKQKFIKNRAFELVESHSEFTNDFKKNKEVLAEFADVHSKKIKNKVAGYITRLKKQKKMY
ncbi:30S ribosomal protein S17e [uncultured archaeon]|nr:30S ribosomal protein S17e [uncultured archaeon]